MNVKRTILSILSRDALKHIVDDLEIDGVDRRSANAMREKLARSRKLSGEDLLRYLRKDELKSACEGMGLPTKGKRDDLVERLLNGHDGSVAPPKKKDRARKTMANNNSEIERRLWAAADEFRANSNLRSSEYSTPVLGLIFLRYADHRFAQAEKGLEGKGSGRRAIGKEDYQAKGVMFLPPTARFSHLLSLPEGENIGKAINDAMKAVEAENEDLKGVLPKTYTKIENSTLVSLLKNFSQLNVDAEGDVFGRIYEYFLGNFAMAEGQKGGEFFTPTSLVKLIVEIIEPYHGRIFDPASGSGGMFAQSADFIKAHKKKPSVEISCYGRSESMEPDNSA